MACGQPEVEASMLEINSAQKAVSNEFCWAMLNCHDMPFTLSGHVTTSKIKGFLRMEEKFQDFPGLENAIFKFKVFQGFHGPVQSKI